MIKRFGGFIWILQSNGAKWPSKPELQIWIVRSLAGLWSDADISQDRRAKA
jgi:hypothetical protein